MYIEDISSRFLPNQMLWVYYYNANYKPLLYPPELQVYDYFRAVPSSAESLGIQIGLLGRALPAQVVQFASLVPEQCSLEQVQFLWNIFTAEEL